jgi:hypothetical protein
MDAQAEGLMNLLLLKSLAGCCLSRCHCSAAATRQNHELNVLGCWLKPKGCGKTKAYPMAISLGLFRASICELLLIHMPSI